ncbi:MAG: universal stress protein [Acidimicrobiales bacterium]
MANDDRDQADATGGPLPPARRFRSIVVGVDGSEGADLALDWAAAEALRSGAGLTVVGAWSYGGHLRSTPSPSDEAAAVVEAARVRLVRGFAEVAVAGEVREGTPAFVLIEAALDADLLVVGARGLGGFHGLPLGSVAQHCLTHGACPVAIVRPSERHPDIALSLRRIVVGVDGSEGADLALDWAVDEARRAGRGLDVVASRVFTGTAGWLFTVDVGVLEAAAEVADAAVAHVARVAPGLDVRREVREEPPAVALTAASRGAELLVVGSRGLGGFRGLLLGSVSQYVGHHAHCTVVVVRGRPPA